MSTNITPVTTMIGSSLVSSRYLSASTENIRQIHEEHSSSTTTNPSASNAYISFAKDEKKYMNPYEKLLYESEYDPRFKAEKQAGRRLGFYRIHKDIGLGNFSRVKLGYHLLAKENVAVKILDKTKLDEKTQRLLLREITSMEKLHHPNIIRLYEVIETPKETYIVTEYASGGDLYTRITDRGKLTEINAQHIFAQIVSAVDHMHSKGIIHRDIKSENVFFAKEGFIKLGDFGFSTYSQKNQTLTTFCGSPPYAAPELYRDENYIGIYVDIWAMGITLYFMVTGQMPFRAENVAKLKKAIMDGHYSIPPYISNQCRELIFGLLNNDISERWTIEKIRSCTWLKNESFTKEFDPFSSNLSNYSTYVENKELTKHSLEDQAHFKLQELGITPEVFRRINGTSDHTHDNINGTYRIIFHRLQKQSNSLERDDSYDKPMKDNRSSSWSRSLSFTNGMDERKIRRNTKNSEVQNTTVCAIL